MTIQEQPESQDLVGSFVQEARVLSDTWTPLPCWTTYLVRLGADAAIGQGPVDAPSTRALVLPTRAFAATFCALGAVLRRLNVPTPVDPAAHFALLRGCPLGSAVEYRTPMLSKFSARLVGHTIDKGVEYIVIEPARGSRILISQRNALDVMLAGKEMTELPELAKSRLMPAYGSLVGALLPTSLARQLVVSSRLECLIVGSEAKIREEVASTKLALEKGSSVVEGTAQDILRVRRFTTDGGLFRSEVLSHTGNDVVSSLELKPAVVIFDGAASFLEWGSRWPAANRIILLDRCERRFSDATREIDLRFVKQQSTSPELLPESPSGVEGIMFWGRP